jgi:hypothetical protein
MTMVTNAKSKTLTRALLAVMCPLSFHSGLLAI